MKKHQTQNSQSSRIILLQYQNGEVMNLKSTNQKIKSSNVSNVFVLLYKNRTWTNLARRRKKPNSIKWKDSLLFLLFQVLYIEELYTKKGPCDNFFSTKETLILPRMIAEICFDGGGARKNCNIFVFIIYPDAACHNTVG